MPICVLRARPRCWRHAADHVISGTRKGSAAARPLHSSCCRLPAPSLHARRAAHLLPTSRVHGAVFGRWFSRSTSRSNDVDTSSPLYEPFSIYNRAEAEAAHLLAAERAARLRQRRSTGSAAFPALPHPLLRPMGDLPDVGSLSILSLACARIHSLIDDINLSEYRAAFSTLQHDPADLLSPVHRERRMREWRLFAHRCLEPSVPPRAARPSYWSSQQYWARWARSLHASLYDPAPLPSTSASHGRHELDLELSLLLSFFHTLPLPSFAHYQLVSRALTRTTLPAYVQPFFDHHVAELPAHLALLFLSAFVRMGDVVRAYISLCRLRQVYERVDGRAYERLVAGMADVGAWEWCERVRDEWALGERRLPQMDFLPIDLDVLRPSAELDADEEWATGSALGGHVDDRALAMQAHLVTAYAKAAKVDEMETSLSTLLSSPSISSLNGSLLLEGAVCAALSATAHRNDREGIATLLQRCMPLLPGSGRAAASAVLVPLVVQGFPPSSLLHLLPSRPLSVLTDVACSLSLLAHADLYREHVLATEGADWIGAVSHQLELRSPRDERNASRGDRRVTAEWVDRVSVWWDWVRKKVERAKRGNAAYWSGRREGEEEKDEAWTDDEEEDDRRPRRRAISLSSGGLRLQSMYHHVLMFLATAAAVPSSAAVLRAVLADSEARLIPLLPTTWAALLSHSAPAVHAGVQQTMLHSLQPLTPAVALALIERCGRRPSLLGVERLWAWLSQRGLHRGRDFYRKALWALAGSADTERSVGLVVRVLTDMRDGGYDVHGTEVHALLTALVRAKAWPVVRALYEEVRTYPQLLLPAVVSQVLHSAWLSQDDDLVQRVWLDVRGRETEEHRWMLALLMTRRSWQGLVPYMLRLTATLDGRERSAASLLRLVLQAARERGEDSIRIPADGIWARLHPFPRTTPADPSTQRESEAASERRAWLDMCELLLLQVKLGRALHPSPEARWDGWAARLGLSVQQEEALVRRLTERSAALQRDTCESHEDSARSASDARVSV